MTPNAEPFLLFRWPLSGRTTAVLTIAGPLEVDDLETLLGNLEAAKRALTKAAAHPSSSPVPMSVRELRRRGAGLTAEIEKIFDNRRAVLEEDVQDAAEEGGRLPFTLVEGGAP